MIAKALSLRQPWAWLVVDGVKQVENRKWKTKLELPLPFLIHSASTFTKADLAFAESWCGITMPKLSSHVYRLGGIIGAAVITHIYPRGAQDGGVWHMKEQYGYRLESITALPFRPLKGQLGFFDVELTAEEETVFKGLL